MTTRMTTVYRFEDAEGLGPWRGGATWAYDNAAREDPAIEDRWHSCGNMPAPCDSREGVVHDHFMEGTITKYHFGFNTLDKLKCAFPSALGRAAMNSKGQRLCVYKVPAEHAFSSASQTIFHKGRANLVGYLDLETLEPYEEPATCAA